MTSNDAVTYLLHEGDCLEWLRSLPSASVDSVVSDPPYPEIDRPYGRMSEPDWHVMMHGVVRECRRILKPTGSAVFILQPNSEHVGKMRAWLWEFMAWSCREWNMVQDAWWWNPSSPPTVHCQRKRGLMRPSVKACVWLGNPDCYRNQDEVLWTQSDAMSAVNREDRVIRKYPSGQSVKRSRVGDTVDERGGVTPFNLIPISNTDSTGSGGAHGHGAATPFHLCSWWVRYLTPKGGIVCDPFTGSGTVGIAALKHGCSFIGSEKMSEYVAMAKERIGNTIPSNATPPASSLRTLRNLPKRTP